MKENILISACLVGKNVKYNGSNNLCPYIDQLKEKYNLILICPEVEGGLLIPRNPAEIIKDKVINSIGEDVTYNYNKGANIALEKAKKYNVKLAILKEKSPSCGSTKIYDGTFSHTLINKSGITADLLIKNNIKVVSELDILDLLSK